jgi:hypothetical protein
MLLNQVINMASRAGQGGHHCQTCLGHQERQTVSYVLNKELKSRDLCIIHESQLSLPLYLSWEPDPKNGDI